MSEVSSNIVGLSLPLNLCAFCRKTLKIASAIFYNGFIMLLLSLVIGLSSCSSKEHLPVYEDRENIDFVYVGHNPPVPDGVQRYCWEEPVVEVQQQGPGVNSAGTSYYPSSVVARQVKKGRWRPCEVKETN